MSLHDLYGQQCIYVCFVLYACAPCVSAGNTHSASLQVGPGDVEWQQSCLSQAAEIGIFH